MKRLATLSLLLICMYMAHAQNDVLYMNNGSVIKGSFLELIPDQTLKFQTNDGSVFVFPMDQVSKMEKVKIATVEGIPTARPDTRTIAKRDGELYWSDNTYNTPEELRNILGTELFETMSSATRQVRKGNKCMFAGVICAAGTIYMIGSAFNILASIDYSTTPSADENRANRFLTGAQVLAIPADALICLGCIFRGIGNKRLDWVRQTYNRLPVQKSAKFSLNPSMSFSPQNDLAFGGTMTISF